MLYIHNIQDIDSHQTGNGRGHFQIVNFDCALPQHVAVINIQTVTNQREKVKEGEGTLNQTQKHCARRKASEPGNEPKRACERERGRAGERERNCNDDRRQPATTL